MFLLVCDGCDARHLLALKELERRTAARRDVRDLVRQPRLLERRDYFGETDEGVNKRARAAYAAGITPIICCGESLAIREAGTYIAHVVAQINAALEGFTADEAGKLVIAYEPIWAIGTGKTATFEQAEEVCKAIREAVAKKFNQQAADAIRIQYGGSVKPATIKDLMQQPNVDGALVGGASLKAQDFAAIVNF